jgi:putative two-component system response regulator
MAERQPASEYCSKCQAVQPILEVIEDSLTIRRCQVCGFTLGSGLVMESDALQPANKVLIVDDDPQIVLMYREILQSNSFMVLTARDGPTGLEMAARERPAIILLDILMPGMDGFEVCRRLQADPDLKSIPVIIITALTDPKLNAQAFKMGGKLALRKPVEPMTVLRTIQVALALAASQRS